MSTSMPFKDHQAKLEYDRRYRQEHREEYARYYRDWRRRNLDRLREYYKEHRERYLEHGRRYYEADKERKRVEQCERTRERRHVMIELLGRKCRHCGFSDLRALQIDHRNGNGSKLNKDLGIGSSSDPRFYRYVISHPEDFQLLCANCNWIKRYEEKEVNHYTFSRRG